MILMALLVATLGASSAPQQIDWNHPNNNPAPLNDHGLCVGLAWIKLRADETATVDYGPDFNVYRVHGPTSAEWDVYAGSAGQSSPDQKHPLLTKNGVTVYRGTDSNGAFNGYFIGEDGRQNHFFGTMFKDSATDAIFFERAIFGAAERAKCEDGKE